VRRVLLLSAACAALSLALSACGTGGYVSSGNQGSGKTLFVDRCGACHTLADAGTSGNIGPNLDDAFAQARDSGMTSDTFTQVVSEQIRFPVTAPVTGSPGMPPPSQTLPTCDSVKQGEFCVEDRDQAIDDIATYVGSVAGKGGAPVQPGGPKPTDGKTIFTSTPPGCGGCHTLADAGTTGTVGPNLDQLKPSKALVIDRVTNGKGVMPSFKDSLNAQQIQAIAEYVSSAAGK
jgi:mono/diheme cytochrome c family protein